MIGTRQYARLAGRTFAPRDEHGRTLAQRYAADGPAIGDTLRVIDGPERGVTVTVVELDGWQFVGLTRNGRRLSLDVANAAPIAPTITPGR